MTGVLALIAATAVSIDVGWQPATGGGFEYIIQIEPELLDSLKTGTDVFSELPPFLRGVRGYRITIGHAELPREGTPPAAEADIAASRVQVPPAGNAAKKSDGAEGPALTGTPADAKQPETGSADRPPDADVAAAKPPAVPGDSDNAGGGARTAGYQQAVAGGGPAPPAEDGSPSNTQAAGYDAIAASLRDKPWLPLTGALVVLFASVGANIYLVMNAVSLRGRYRALVARAG
ncbi:MAG: hypothetical protein HYX69_18095 [Planctomycetia bacterium]|nr:hypothetical protein [Planctomycetia bacterium]